MRLFFSLILFTAIFNLGCSTHTKNLTTDVGTMEEGNRLAEDEFFEEARKQYYRIKTEFPQSNLQVQADLKIADTYFNEEAYQTAATQYEEFIKTYPGRPEIPDALYKMGMSYANQMPSDPQRDTRGTLRAVDSFTRLLVDYPNSKYTAEAQKKIEEAREQLATKIFEIAQFYQKRGDHFAAARRYGELIDQYSESRRHEEALALQIWNLKKAGMSERAQELSSTFKSKYPQSQFSSLVGNE